MAEDTRGGVKSSAETAGAPGGGAAGADAPSSGSSIEGADEDRKRTSPRAATKTKPAPTSASDEARASADETPDDATGTKVAAPSAAATMRAVATPRRARVVLKKIGPWSVLKFSLLFYFFVMIVFLLALTILYLLMDALGTLDSTVKLATEFGLVERGFEINGKWLFLRTFAGGVALVVLWSIINVFATFLYNLISDIVGGIEVTLAEKR